MEKLEGIIVVYKEKGCTSHDVVDKVRDIVGVKKVGHTGTLDPEAEGVLPVCIGNATKVVEYMTEKDKEYIATIKFGVVTDTQDMTGKVIAEQDDFSLDENEVTKTIMSFVGEYMQTPPMFSAVKVKGKKLYEYARNGETVKIPARRVIIKEIEILEIGEKTAKIRVVCSKGTYIRTLCHDIGKKLKVGAAMQSLIRTRTGAFEIKDSVTVEELDKIARNKTLNAVVYKMDRVFIEYPKLNVVEASLRKLENGNKLELEDTEEHSYIKLEEKTYAVYCNSIFYALYKGCFEEGKMILRVEKMFNGGNKNE